MGEDGVGVSDTLGTLSGSFLLILRGSYYLGYVWGVPHYRKLPI